VRYAYYIGSACLLLSVLWTVAFTRERPATGGTRADGRPPEPVAAGPIARLSAGGWTPAIGGAALLLTALLLRWQWEVVVLAFAAALVGAAQLAAGRRRARGDASLGLLQIGEDFVRMPAALRRLALVQFFTWFGLFAMWIYAAPAVARSHFGTADPGSAEFNAAADWVGILFATYNGVAAIGALALPAVSARIGERGAYALCLGCGAFGMAGFVLIPDPDWLWIAAVGIGLAWAAILSLPYAIIVNAVPPAKVGVYLGIHNIFLVIPQLVAAICLGPIVAGLFGGEPIHALGLAALFLGLAALAALLIPPPQP
jgi:maltose/moltooligosaccharide transporter